MNGDNSDWQKYIEIERFKLDNGLNVVLVPNRKNPTISVNVSYKVGSKDEDKNKTGMAHLFEHLMFEGTRNVPKDGFDKLCSLAGGNNNAYTSFDITSYYSSLPSNQLELGLWLESDRLANFEITEKSLENQKKVVAEEIKQTTDDLPYGMWRELISSESFAPECSYSWEVQGKKEHVAGVTLEDAVKFRDKFYQPNNACLTISGDIKTDETFKLIEKYFGGIESTATEISRNKFSNDYRQKNKRAKFSKNVPLPAVFIAFHSPGFTDKSVFPVDLLTNILGIGKSSRLYKALIEDKQIASECGAFLEKSEHSSLLTCYAFANELDVSVDALSEEITKVILELNDNGIEEKEIQKARNVMKTQLAKELSSFTNISDAVSQQTLFWDDPERIFKLLGFYSKYSREDVSNTANEILKPEEAVRIEAVLSQ